MIDFSLDETQEQIVAMARTFGREVLQPAEIALDRLADPEAVFKDERFQKMMAQAYELGFHKMTLFEDYGGLGLDPITVGLVWEELGRYGAGVAAGLAAASVAQQLITFLQPGNRALIDRFVTPFCKDQSGTLCSAWGSSEPDVGSDGSNYYDPKIHHRTTAVKRNGTYVINGTKSNFVSNGGIADLFIIFACIDPSKGIRGSGAFIVPADTKGVTRGKAIDKIGLRVLNQAPVYFDEVEVPEEYLIFPPCDAYPMLHTTIHTVGNIRVGFLALGLMRAAYEEALAYSKERVQWGKPIVEHQLITKKLVDAFAAIEATRAFLWKASWHSKQHFPGDAKMSISAKIYSTNQAVFHTGELLQALGGYGISRDYTLEKYVRDAHLLKIMDATNENLMLKVGHLL